MDMISQFLEIAQNSSPWVVLIGGILVGLWLVLNHRKDMAKHKVKSGLESAIESLHQDLAAHTARDEEMLTTVHKAMGGNADVLTQILQQLVSLNSKQEGGLSSPDNVRRIILYQWNWCRDETVRILFSSIERNHIKDREEFVAAAVYRAWSRAAHEAITSLDQIKGITVPYSGLFDGEALNAMRSMIWHRALPLYYKDYASGTHDDHVDNLKAFIHDLFDRAFETFVDVLYVDGSTYDPKNERSNTSIAFNADFVNRMVKEMTTYGSGTYKAVKNDESSDRIKVQTEVEHAMQRAQTKSRKSP